MKKNKNNISNLKESSKFNEIYQYIEKIELLADIYNDFYQKNYENKEKLELGKLKMKLTKKELLLLNYLLNKEIEKIDPKNI